MNIVVLVDATLAARKFSEMFAKKGYQCIYVASRQLPKRLLNMVKFEPNDFVALFKEEKEGLENLVEKLKQYPIKCIYPAGEAGVSLTDIISQRLNLPGNGTRHTAAKRNKFLMNALLESQNIPVAKQYKSSDVEAIIQWVRNDCGWPVVLKPLWEAASINVFKCDNEQQLRQCFQAIQSSTSLFNEINHEVLVNEFLQGVEYIVDSISCEGKHAISNIWMTEKDYIEGEGIVHLYKRLLPYQGEVQAELIRYTELVLTALEIKYGACHAEIMYTQRGPVLIEMNCRLSGFMDTAAELACVGFDPIDLSMDSYVDPKTFNDWAKAPYSLQKHMLVVHPRLPKSGIIKAIPLLEIIDSCESYFSKQINVKPGDRVKKTHDLLSAAGKVILIHENKDVLEKDYAKLRKAEINGFVYESENLNHE